MRPYKYIIGLILLSLFFKAKGQTTIPDDITFYIQCYDDRGHKIHTGTGFFLDNSYTGILLHKTLRDASGFEIILQNGKTLEPEKVTGYDPITGLIRISFKYKRNIITPLARFSQNRILEAENLVAVEPEGEERRLQKSMASIKVRNIIGIGNMALLKAVSEEPEDGSPVVSRAEHPAGAGDCHRRGDAH